MFVSAVFFGRSVFFCLIWVSGVFIENLFFLLWSNFRNVFCINVFSVEEYSGFTGATNVQSQ